MRHIKIYLYLLFSLICYCCETAIEVDIPRQPAQLTANALFTPDSVWKVELINNRYILDTAQFAAVPDASVQIKQQGQVVAVLDYQGDDPYSGNSIYIAKDSHPVVGKNYTLEVKHPTLGNLTANSLVPVPKTAILRVVLDTTDVRQDVALEEKEIACAVTIRLADPPGDDYYSLSFIVRYNIFFSIDIDNDGELELGAIPNSDNVKLYSDDPVVDDPFDQFRDEVLFKDVAFDGQEYVLKTYIAYRTDNLVFTELLSSKKDWIIGEDVYDLNGNVVLVLGDTVISRLYVVLRTTTKDYYQYSYTRDLQASVESNPFAQPVQVYDNIDNGLGIFGGYSQVIKEAIIR